MRRKIALVGIVMLLLLASPALADTKNGLIGKKTGKGAAGSQGSGNTGNGHRGHGGGRPEWAGKG